MLNHDKYSWSSVQAYTPPALFQQSYWMDTHLQLLEHSKPHFRKQKSRELEDVFLPSKAKYLLQVDDLGIYSVAKNMGLDSNRL